LILLVRPQLTTLTQRGRLDIWSPRSVSAPTLGQVHEVRTTRDGEPVTWARKLEYREGVLQDLTFPEAMAAGFKTRDDFYGWFRKKFDTGPLMNEPVLTTVVTYELVAEEPVEYLHQRSEFGYTRSRMASMDAEWTVPKSVRRQFAEEGWRGFGERQAERIAEHESRPWSERLADLERLEASGVDVSRALNKVRAFIVRAEARAKREAA
jgi:hypothetical protein